jgi:hypothetical protein
MQYDSLFSVVVVCPWLDESCFVVWRLAKLVRFVPETGMIGFMNGLTIIIAALQMPAFQR